jgi:hypothetical protein
VRSRDRGGRAVRPRSGCAAEDVGVAPVRERTVEHRSPVARYPMPMRSPAFPRSSTTSDPVTNPARLPSDPAIRPMQTHPGAVRPRNSPMASRIMPIASAVDVLDYTQATAAHHGCLLAHVRRSGSPRGAHDLIIAAHAVETGRTPLPVPSRSVGTCCRSAVMASNGSTIKRFTRSERSARPAGFEPATRCLEGTSEGSLDVA